MSFDFARSSEPFSAFFLYFSTLYPATCLLCTFTSVEQAISQVALEASKRQTTTRMWVNARTRPVEIPTNMIKRQIWMSDNSLSSVDYLTRRRVVKIEAVLKALQISVPRPAKVKSKKSIGTTAIRVIRRSGSPNLTVNWMRKKGW